MSENPWHEFLFALAVFFAICVVLTLLLGGGPL